MKSRVGSAHWLNVSGRAIVAGALLAFGSTGMAQTTEVVLGFSLPLTGGAAKEGNEARVGAEVAASYLASNGGFKVGDRTVNFKVVFEDDKCNPQAATEAANRLVTAGAKFVGGSFCSSAALAQMPVFAALKVPQIVYAYADDLTGAARKQAGADMSVRLGANAAIEMAPLAKYAVLHEKHKKFFAMAQNTDFGRSMVKQFRKTAEQLGGSFVAEPEYFPFAATDYRTLLTKAKNSGADAILAIGLAQETIGIMGQHKELGISQPVFGSDLLGDVSVMSAVGNTLPGAFGPWYYDDGTQPREFPRTKAESGATLMRTVVSAKIGKDPSRNHGLGWGTVMLLKQAMARSGSIEPKVVMQEVLSGHVFELPYGDYGFRPCGQADMRAGVAGFTVKSRILVADRDYAGTAPVVLTSDDLCK